MNFVFCDYLKEKLVKAKTELEIDCSIEVGEEQIFAKMDKFEPKTIYVVVKNLSSDMIYNAETLPIQLVILSERNSVKNATALFNKFTTENNWRATHYSDGTYVKQQWNSPAVLNNFTEVDVGYRSVLYVSGTLYIMHDTLDIQQFQYIISEKVYNPDTQKYDTVYHRYDIKPLTFSYSYVMTPNTQPIGGNKLATSVKNVASLSITFMLPLTNTELINEIVKISAGVDSGNLKFNICFKIGNVKFGQVEDADNQFLYVLTLAQVVTDPEKVPSLQVGMQL